MAKKPCLDCIDKYEKSKQRKRNAKKRQKQTEEATRPTVTYNVPRGADRFIPPSGSLGSSPQNLTDLLAVLRVNEAMRDQKTRTTLDTLERTPTGSEPRGRPKTANEAVSQVADNYVDMVKSIPEIVRKTVAGTVGVPFQFIQGASPGGGDEPTLERSSKSKPGRPKTANEAASDSLDLFVDTARTGPGLVRDVATQLPRDIRTTASAPFKFAGEIAGNVLSSAKSAASSVGEAVSSAGPNIRFLGEVLSAAGEAAGAAAPAKSDTLERTAPATGGDTPAIQFVGGTGRVLETAPEEQGANPLPSVFLATPPPANLLDDLQRGGLSEEKRRIADILASPTPQYTPPQGVLTPESEVADALGERTILDLAVRPQVDAPLVPNPLALYPEGEGLAPIEEQLTPEEEANFVDAEGEPEEELVVVEGVLEPALSPELSLEQGESLLPPDERGQPIETAASLVDGRGAEDLPLTPASLVSGEGSLSPRTLTRQTTEELAKSIEDVDITDLSALQLQKDYDKQKRDEKKLKKEEQKRKKLEAQLAKIADDEERAVREAQITEGKRLKAEEALRKKEEKTKGKRVEKRTPSQLQIAGLTKRDIAGSPRLETFFGGTGLQTRFQQRQGASSLTAERVEPADEEPQQITFTQPTAERTFKPFEGGGI